MTMRTAICCVCFMLIGSVQAGNNNDAGHWGPATEGCRVMIRPDKVEYDPGEPITIHISLQNESRDLLRVMDSGMPYSVDVLWQNSVSTAPLTEWGQWLASPFTLTSTNVISLERGGVYRDELLLNRAYDMTRDGKYEVTLRWGVRSEIDPHATVQVTSNTIVLSVK